MIWDITGPGTHGEQGQDGTTWLNYNLVGPAVYSGQTWTATAIADEAGSYIFDWNYSGFHAFFLVTAFLDASQSGGAAARLVNAGPAVCCSMPSNGFAYAGNYTFANVNAGDTLRFSFGGSKADSNATLRGNADAATGGRGARAGVGGAVRPGTGWPGGSAPAPPPIRIPSPGRSPRL